MAFPLVGLLASLLGGGGAAAIGGAAGGGMLSGLGGGGAAGMMGGGAGGMMGGGGGGLGGLLGSSQPDPYFGPYAQGQSPQEMEASGAPAGVGDGMEKFQDGAFNAIDGALSAIGGIDNRLTGVFQPRNQHGAFQPNVDPGQLGLQSLLSQISQGGRY